MKGRLALAALGAALSGVALAQDDLAKAKAAEARRVALVNKLAPSVGAFFQKATVGQGGGSGVVIDPRGYAITNFHVSLVHHELLVGLNDGKLYPAALLGIDPGGDIALAKLTGKPRFDYAVMGNSDEVRPGDRVLVMGNPFLLATDYQPTVTEGIVSGVHRFRAASGGTDLVYGDCIQIDASINPGNSGGPLFDEAGRWIGINGLGGFRPDRGRVNVGVGYAASVDQIKNFIEDLRAGKQAEHGTLDATVRDLPDDDDPSRTLVKLDAIVKDSVAYQAKLELGDVVVALDGVPIKTQNQFLTLISRLPAGRRVKLTIDRRREDATIGGKNNYVRRTVGVRLKGVPSGPDDGKWQPLDDAMAEERRITIEAARRGTRPLLDPARGFDIRGTRREGGVETPFRWAQKGPRVRVELGNVVVASDGKGPWRRRADGVVENLPRLDADVIEGTAVALDAILRDGGEGDLGSVEFTGGELVGSVRASRLETRDKAGRRRKLYFDAATGAFCGLAHPDAANDKLVEMRWVFEGKKLVRIERLDDFSGDVLSEDAIASVASLEDDSIFARPAGKDGK